MAKSKRHLLVDKISNELKELLGVDTVTCKIPRKGNKVWFTLAHSDPSIVVKAPIAKHVIFNKKVDFKKTIIETVPWFFYISIKDKFGGVASGNS